MYIYFQYKDFGIKKGCTSNPPPRIKLYPLLILHDALWLLIKAVVNKVINFESLYNQA